MVLNRFRRTRGEPLEPGAETCSSRRFTTLLVAAMGFGLVARVAYVLVIGRKVHFGFDAIWYELQGSTLAKGKGYIDPATYFATGRSVPTANFPPLWPAVLALADRIGLDTQTWNQLVGAMVGTITVGLTGLLGRRVAGPRVGLLAAVLVAACPMLIAADGSLMSESLYVALITAVALVAYWALDGPSPWRFASVGILVGLAALTRADALFLAPILAGALAWRVGGRSLNRRVALGAVLLCAMAVVLVPWVVYSSSRMGGTVLLSSNSGNMLEGANCAGTYHGKLLGAWDARCLRDKPPKVSELAWASESRSVALDYARGHAVDLPLVAAARVMRVWGLWSPADQARLEAIETRSVPWQIFAWGYDLVIFALAVVGAALLVRRGTELTPLVAIVAAVVVTAALSNGNQRFRLAAEPVVAIAAAVAILAAWLARRPDPAS